MLNEEVPINVLIAGVMMKGITIIGFNTIGNRK
ncbi:hypothetical protein FORC67_2723 [Listeria monocytogenes]|nr:hypothetical protein FORC67_2723 [Listeria monocytogenes]